MPPRFLLLLLAVLAVSVAHPRAYAEDSSPGRGVSLPHPRGACEAGEHGFGGGTHGEAVRVGASPEQLTSITAPENSGSGTVSLGYDSVGRLTTVDDALSGVTTTLAYAPSGLPQALSLETSLIQQAEAEGRAIYNVVQETISPATVVEVPGKVTPSATLLNPAVYPR